MRNYISEIYDEIIRDNSDILLSRAKSSRVILLIFAKFVNLFRLQFLSLFRRNPDIRNKNIALSLTHNQNRSILPLVDDNFLALSCFLDMAELEKTFILFFSPFRYPIDLLRHILYFYRRKAVSWKQQYNSVAYFYYYKSFKRYFINTCPKSLTITNPSHPILRAAILASRDLGIPTVYLPHASASPLYPVINTDYALLEGKDALDVYRFSESTKKILVGATRLESYKNMKPQAHVGINILIAANLLDDINKVLALIKILKNHNDTKHCNLLFRPHPNLRIDESIFSELGVEVISTQRESCLQSIERTDILISANSTIFFEAIYLPIRCYYYDFVKEGLRKDSYNLFSFSFIHKLDTNKSIKLSPCYISKEEADRIDVTIYNKENSISIIKQFYNTL